MSEHNGSFVVQVGLQVSDYEEIGFNPMKMMYL
jgi:hypothetical protein